MEHCYQSHRMIQDRVGLDLRTIYGVITISFGIRDSNNLADRHLNRSNNTSGEQQMRSRAKKIVDTAISMGATAHFQPYLT